MNYLFLSIVLTVIISVLPSLFALHIRTALKEGGKISRVALAVAENRLAVLNLIHRNVYEFMLWLCLELRQPFYETAILIFLVFMIRLRGSVLWTIPASILLGGWIGTSCRLFGMIRSLKEYERSKSKLEEQIVKLKGRATASASYAA